MSTNEQQNGRARRPPPLTAAELQELNRTMKSATGRRLLWEIHRLRAFVLPAHHLEILVRDNQHMYNDQNVRNLINTLRWQLDVEPAIEEELDKHDARVLRKYGLNFKSPVLPDRESKMRGTKNRD